MSPARYATRAAQQFVPHATLTDFRTAFLAITSAVLREPSDAVFVGPTRDAERWNVVIAGRRMDVIYDPAGAVIVAVVGARTGNLFPRAPEQTGRARAHSGDHPPSRGPLSVTLPSVQPDRQQEIADAGRRHVEA